MAINSALTVLLAVCVLPEITSSAVELTASPTSLDDGQGVVIYIQSDSPPHHLDAVVATCTNGLGTSVVQRVPRTTAVVAAPCDVADAKQMWHWEPEGRIVSIAAPASETGGRRCLDAGCFESESSGIFSGDVSLCPDDRREFRGVQWCHAALDASGEGFTSNAHHAQGWTFTREGQLRTDYDGQCLSRNAPSAGTGRNGTNEALNFFRCESRTASMQWSYDRTRRQIRSGGADGEQDGSEVCLALDDEGMALAPPKGYSGAVRFGTLPQLRCDWEFTYLSVHGEEQNEENEEEEEEEAVAVAKVLVPSRIGADVPRHIRLSVGDAPGEMWVSFTSNSNASLPVVEYAVSSGGGGDGFVGGAVRNETGTSVTYFASDMCEAPANRAGPFGWVFPGYQHHVKLTGLLSSQNRKNHRRGAAADVSAGAFFSGPAFADNNRLAYRVGLADGTGGWSDVRNVAILPPANDEVENGDDLDDDEPLTFLGFGDMGVSAAQQSASTILWGLKDVVDASARFALHFGDLGYACGVGLIWDAWHSMIEPLSSRIPYLVSMGNHEFVWAESYVQGHDSGGECGVPVEKRFRGPSNGEGILWYSFSSGPVHVVMLSTEHDLTPGSEQYAWFEKDLAAAAQQRAAGAVPWIVVTAHRMLYTTQLCEDADLERAAGLRAALDPLLAKYKVNLVLVGHQHSYERTCAIINGTCSSSSSSSSSSDDDDGDSGVYGNGVGTVHAVVGSAGAELEKCGFSSLNGVFDIAHANMWGYARMTATRKAFTFQFISNNDGSIFDEVQLTPWGV